MTLLRFPVSWYDRNKNETLLAAASRLLLGASEFGIPLAQSGITVTSSEHQKSGLLSGMSIGIVLRIRVMGEVGELGLITCAGR